MNDKTNTAVKDDFDISDEDAELAGLSETELEALGLGGGSDDAGDDDNQDDKDTDTAGDDDADDDKGADDKDDDDAGTDTGDDKETSTDKETGDDKGGEDDKDAEAATKTSETDNKPFSPQYTTETNAEYAEKMADINTRMEDLGEQLDNGEITAREFQKGNMELMAERDELTKAALKSEIFTDMNSQSAAQLWQTDQKNFFDAPENKMYTDNNVLYSAMDATVREVANEEKYENSSGSEILREADRRVRSMMNIPATSKKDEGDDKGKEDKKTDAEKTLEQRRKDKEKNEDLTTLGGLPAADETETGNDEFAYMDKLDGIELEAALNKMTPEQQERYYRS